MRGTTHVLAEAQGPAGGVGDQRLVVGDRQPHRHAGALVDVRALAGQLAEGGDDLGHELGHRHSHAVGRRAGAASWATMAISVSTSSG